MLMPSVAKFKWTSVKQLSGWKDATRRKLYDAIKKDVELLLQRPSHLAAAWEEHAPLCAQSLIVSL
jgi:hypothetical protein